MNCHFLQKRNGKIQLKWIKLTFGAMLDQLRFIFVEWNMCHLADRMANAIINTFCAVYYYYHYLRAWACGRCIIACVYRQNVWTHKAQQTAFATTHTIPWIRNCIFNWTTICSFDFSCLILMSVHFWLVDGLAQVSPSQIQFSFGCVCDVRALGEWWVHRNVLFIELNTPGTRYTFISHFVLALGERVRVWSDKLLICIYNWVSYNLWARAWHNCHAFYYSNFIRLSAVQHRQWAGRLLLHLSEWSYHWCGHKSSPIKLCFGSSDKSELLNWRLMKRECISCVCGMREERVCVAIKWSHLLIHQSKMTPARRMEIIIGNWLVAGQLRRSLNLSRVMHTATDRNSFRT